MSERKKPLTLDQLKAAKLEALSAELHAVYQAESRRQAGTGDDTVRHPDDYAALPEHTKEYDRVLARYILQRESKLRLEIVDACMKFLLIAWEPS